MTTTIISYELAGNLINSYSAKFVKNSNFIYLFNGNDLIAKMFDNLTGMTLISFINN